MSALILTPLCRFYCCCATYEHNCSGLDFIGRKKKFIIYNFDTFLLVLQCGVVMKQCDSLKVLPQKNSAAVAAKLLSHADLIKDALR